MDFVEYESAASHREFIEYFFSTRANTTVIVSLLKGTKKWNELTEEHTEQLR